MRSAIVAVGLALVVAIAGIGAENAQVLLVDRTDGLMESMQVEVLARVLLSSGLFSIRAATETPNGPHPSGPFEYVVIIPQGGEWIWVCTPSLPEASSADAQQALSVIEGAINEIFIGSRQAANPSDDLYAFMWSAYFLNIGILEGVQ